MHKKKVLHLCKSILCKLIWPRAPLKVCVHVSWRRSICNVLFYLLTNHNERALEICKKKMLESQYWWFILTFRCFTARCHPIWAAGWQAEEEILVEEPKSKQFLNMRSKIPVHPPNLYKNYIGCRTKCRRNKLSINQKSISNFEENCLLILTEFWVSQNKFWASTSKFHPRSF